MNNKIAVVASFACGLVIGFAALGLYFHNQMWPREYEFHTGSDGQVMWQCNRRTGEIKILTSYTAGFELWKGESHDYILNKQNGQVWRYYKNDTNSIPDEGFAPLDYGKPQSIK